MKIVHHFMNYFIIGARLVLFVLLIVSSSNLFASTDQKSQNNSFVTVEGTVKNYTDAPLLIGGNVDLSDKTTDSAIIIGGDIDLGGIITQNIAVTGGKLLISSVVGGNSFLMGGEVDILPNSEFAKHTLIIGGNVTIEGRFNDSLTILAGKVVFSGHVKGDVRIMAGIIDIQKPARIDGSLQYTSPEKVSVADGAIIKGGIKKWAKSKPKTPKEQKIWHWWHLPGLFFNIGLFLIGFLVVIVFPNFSKKTAYQFINRPLASLGVGFVTLFIPLIAVLILFFTVIGIPLAIITLLLYLAALLFSYIYAAFGLGMLIHRIAGKGHLKESKWHLLLSVFIGFILLYLLRTIPLLGSWIHFFALLFGLGALVLAMTHSYKTEKQAVYL